MPQSINRAPHSTSIPDTFGRGLPSGDGVSETAAADPMALWWAASYARVERTQASHDEPIALLLSEADANVPYRAMRDHMRPLYRAHYGVDDIAFPTAPGAIVLYEGCPVYAVPWLTAGQFAWAWGPLPRGKTGADKERQAKT